MAVIFDRKSAHINTEFQRAKPDCFIDDPWNVHFHLTEGFNSNRICKRGHGPALAAQGKINVSASPADLVGWDFRFIQVARENKRSLLYAGRTRKEGSIEIHSHIPPALPNSLLLDGTSAADPWIRFGSGTLAPVIKPTQMTDDMSDHPSSCASKVARNTQTKSSNFLFHAVTEYELWTTLCAKDPAGKIQQFAHFHWLVRWDQQFKWHGDSIMRGPTGSIITNNSVVLGPSSEPAIQALVNSPADPVAVVGFNEAARNFPHTPPNYTENSDWLYNVPPDFFTPK